MPRAKAKPATKPRENVPSTGTYAYDKELGKIVKVSDRVPGLKKGGSAPVGPCGRTACGGGRCNPD